MTVDQQVKGTYALLLRSKREKEIAIGKLGLFAFPVGYYLYVGSALGNGGLPARLARYRRQGKRPHWHIDYLLKHSELIEIWSIASEERMECLWASIACELPGAQIPVTRFGSSDCHCPAHLIYFPTPPSFTLFEKRLKDYLDLEIRLTKQPLSLIIT